MMCHFSSECGNCCKICQSKCNGNQICGVNNDDEQAKDRLEAWLEIIEIDRMSHLKKFMV